MGLALESFSFHLHRILDILRFGSPFHLPRVISAHADPPSATPAYSVRSWLSPSLGHLGTFQGILDIVQ
jgi:hypothetical protein